ncbi:sugar-binding protein [Psychrosphaera algicola]
MTFLSKLKVSAKVIATCSLFAATYLTAANDAVTPSFVAHHIDTAIVIDGELDKQWDKATWHNLDQPILGGMPDKSDFNGRFKLLWDKDALYLVAEFEDDVLIDKIADPLEFYWDDDTLEVFLDEDASGGEHQFNYNAFAYHVALDNQAVDIGEKDSSGKTPFLTLNDHIKSRWMRHQNGKVIWEMAISVYDDSFKPNIGKQPVTLH